LKKTLELIQNEKDRRNIFERVFYYTCASNHPIDPQDPLSQALPTEVFTTDVVIHGLLEAVLHHNHPFINAIFRSLQEKQVSRKQIMDLFQEVTHHKPLQQRIILNKFLLSFFLQKETIAQSPQKDAVKLNHELALKSSYEKLASNKLISYLCDAVLDKKRTTIDVIMQIFAKRQLSREQIMELLHRVADEKTAKQQMPLNHWLLNRFLQRS
jgi:DNA helicase IV